MRSFVTTMILTARGPCATRTYRRSKSSVLKDGNTSRDITDKASPRTRCRATKRSSESGFPPVSLPRKKMKRNSTASSSTPCSRYHRRLHSKANQADGSPIMQHRRSPRLKRAPLRALKSFFTVSRAGYALSRASDHVGAELLRGPFAVDDALLKSEVLRRHAHAAQREVRVC